MKTLRSVALASVVVATVCAGLLAADEKPSKPETESTFEVVRTSEVEWQHLNPARGDKSPRAGTLWGDRNADVPTGYLLKPTDGFRSPPHIHNVSYRGVVIRGLIHNDDPQAEEMWMPAGSFWTQPKGGVHITAAKGQDTLAYIEIDSGPYLVRPVEEEFDSGEVPVNVDPSNIVWLDASNITWLEQPGASASVSGPKIAFLWGQPQDDELNGTLVKLPAEFTGLVRSHGSSLRAVVIQGRLRHQVPSKTDATTLEPGSYFSSTGKSAHHVSCETSEECVIYVRMAGTFDITPATE